MGVIGRPEEPIVAHILNDMGERPLVRVAGNPALALEIDAGFFLERHIIAQAGLIRRIHPVQRRPYPARTGLKQDDLDPGKTVEQPPLKHAVERLLGPLHAERILHPACVLHAFKTLIGPNLGMFGHRMDGDRHFKLLGLRPKGIVIGMGMRDTRERIGCDKSAFGSLAHGSFKLGRGGYRVGQRNMRNSNQATVRVGTEITDPAVVRLGIRQGQVYFINLALPGQTQAGI